MQLLSSIADLKDIVNKEYIDSILADYVLSANLGALATKDSLAFSDLTSRPSKLSDFTDDVVAGKYLELSGGRMQGSINWAIEQTSAWDNFFNTGSNLGLRILNTAGYSVEGAPSDYAVGLIVSGYYGYALAWDANNEQLKYRGSGKSDWRTLLHSGNVGEYAFTPRAQITSNTDADTLITNGVYLNATGNGSGNSNFPSAYSILISAAQENIYAAQISIASDFMHVRRKIDTWSDWKTIAFTDSNVASATKLATARTIWGQSFDGTGDVNGDAYISTRLAVGNSSTLSPNYTLYVGGNGKIKASTKSGIDTTTIKNSAILELSGSKEDALFIGQQSNSDMWMQAAYQGTTLYPSQNHTYNLLLQPLGGNVGIRTTDPKYTLDVNGQLSTPYYLSFRNASDSEFSYIGRGGSAATLTIMTYGAGNPLNFGTNSKTRMHINGDGNVTIGNSDLAGTSAKLHVDGLLYSSAVASATSLSLNRNPNSGAIYRTDKLALAIENSATAITFNAYSGNGSKICVPLTINDSGNVTIGSSDTASSEYKLDVVGKARVSDELIVTNPTGIRWAYGNYGTLFRNDGQNFYILFTDSGGALTGSWNNLRPFRISLTTGDVTMEHNLTVDGQVKAGAEACANKRFVIFAPYEQAKGVSFGYMKATIANAYNIGIAHLGCNYGGASDITNTSVDYTAISMYRSVVGIGKEYDYASIRAIYDAKADLGVTKGVMIGSATLLWDSASSSLKMSNLLTAKGGINVTATDSANNSGQSGVAGVFLRNEGGIEISHASTPYIDFHYAKSTSDFDVRLICQSTNDLRISGHFYPMFSLNYELGAQSLRWSAIWAGGMNLSGNADISGVATVGSLKIGNIVLSDDNGTLKIAGNAYTTGQLGAGEAGQPTSGGGSVQYWSNEYDMDIGTDILVSSKEYIGTNTIVGWDLAGSCLNDLYIGYDGYTIWMQGSVDEASDMRLKTVIDAVNLDIRDIAYAPIFNYVFKSRPQGRQMLGSSAQYWQAIAPKAVSENDKGNLAMNYGAIALASVVAVAKKVVTHEEEIAELKSKVQSLETRLAKYELN